MKGRPPRAECQFNFRIDHPRSDKSGRFSSHSPRMHDRPIWTLVIPFHGSSTKIQDNFNKRYTQVSRRHTKSPCRAGNFKAARGHDRVLRVTLGHVDASALNRFRPIRRRGESLGPSGSPLRARRGTPRRRRPRRVFQGVPKAHFSKFAGRYPDRPSDDPGNRSDSG